MTEMEEGHLKNGTSMVTEGKLKGAKHAWHDVASRVNGQVISNWNNDVQMV